MCITVGRLPVKLAHEDTLQWMALVKADDVVNNVLETETKHIFYPGSCDDALVDGETTGARQRLIMGNTAFIRDKPRVINRALFNYAERGDRAVWDLVPRVQGLHEAEAPTYFTINHRQELILKISPGIVVAVVNHEGVVYITVSFLDGIHRRDRAFR
jgi:hypothetical protein